MQRSKQFIKDEIKEIKKYLEDEKKAGKTVDNDTVSEWVEKNSDNFQKKWEMDHT